MLSRISCNLVSHAPQFSGRSVEDKTNVQMWRASIGDDGRMKEEPVCKKPLFKATIGEDGFIKIEPVSEGQEVHGISNNNGHIRVV